MEDVEMCDIRPTQLSALDDPEDDGAAEEQSVRKSLRTRSRRQAAAREEEDPAAYWKACVSSAPVNVWEKTWTESGHIRIKSWTKTNQQNFQSKPQREILDEAIKAAALFDMTETTEKVPKPESEAAAKSAVPDQVEDPVPSGPAEETVSTAEELAQPPKAKELAQPPRAEEIAQPARAEVSQAIAEPASAIASVPLQGPDGTDPAANAATE